MKDIRSLSPKKSEHPTIIVKKSDNMNIPLEASKLHNIVLLLT